MIVKEREEVGEVRPSRRPPEEEFMGKPKGMISILN